jgi:glycosyltransferase involved in cell wall biosynthesis
VKRIIYIFDDINYQSGALKAALYQMKCLSDRFDVYALSLSEPVNDDIPGQLLKTPKLWKRAEVCAKSFREVVFNNYSLSDKLKKIFYSVTLRLGKGERFLDSFLYGEIPQYLESFDIVIVVSEASKIRYLVSRLKAPLKVQWIHTDYALWSEYSEWTRLITKNDARIYSDFDYIIVLSEKSREGMIKKLPEFSDKTIVIPNLVDYAEIKKKSMEDLGIDLEECLYRFVTVGRIDKEKNFERILSVCRSLKSDNINYRWYLIGDGPQKKHIYDLINKMDLKEYVVMLGHMDNPYPIMKQCDIIVLLSDYEGTPMTIDEAAVLEKKVIATPVGGIPEQLQRYGNGKLVRLDKNLYVDFFNAINEETSVRIKSIEELNNEVLKKMEQLFQ